MWAKVNSDGTIKVMRQAENQPEAEFNMDRDLLESARGTALWTNVATALADLKREAKEASDAAKVLKRAADKKATPPAAGQVAQAASDLKASPGQLTAALAAMIDKLDKADAVCFFGMACFAAGTPIRTPGGWQAIETLRVGDRVLSRSEHDPHGPVEAKVVEEVFVRFGDVWHLTVEGRLVRTTGEHPFYAWDKGWVPARELAAGDTVLCEGGEWRSVEEVVDTRVWEAVYSTI